MLDPAYRTSTVGTGPAASSQHTINENSLDEHSMSQHLNRPSDSSGKGHMKDYLDMPFNSNGQVSNSSMPQQPPDISSYSTYNSVSQR